MILYFPSSFHNLWRGYESNLFPQHDLKHRSLLGRQNWSYPNFHIRIITCAFPPYANVNFTILHVVWRLVPFLCTATLVLHSDIRFASSGIQENNFCKTVNATDFSIMSYKDDEDGKWICAVHWMDIFWLYTRTLPMLVGYYNIITTYYAYNDTTNLGNVLCFPRWSFAIECNNFCH